MIPKIDHILQLVISPVFQGGCKDVPLPIDWVQDPSKKREIDHEKRKKTMQTTTIEGTSSEFASPLADGSLTFVAVSLDELQQGQYELAVTFNRTVGLLSWWTTLGRSSSRKWCLSFYPTLHARVEHARIDAPQSPVIVSFVMDEDVYVPAALVLDTEQRITVSYSGTIKPLNATEELSPSASSPARTSGSSGRAFYAPYVLTVFVVALSLFT